MQRLVTDRLLAAKAGVRMLVAVLQEQTPLGPTDADLVEVALRDTWRLQLTGRTGCWSSKQRRTEPSGPWRPGWTRASSTRTPPTTSWSYLSRSSSAALALC
jgi:hypothetical protein